MRNQKVDIEYSQDNWDDTVKLKGENPNSVLNYPTQNDIIDFNRKEYMKNEMVNHPNHYGGEDNPYEAIKVIEEWDLGFNLGNAVKYISRVGKKNNTLEDLKKASWYINREINKLKNK